MATLLTLASQPLGVAFRYPADGCRTTIVVAAALGRARRARRTRGAVPVIARPAVLATGMAGRRLSGLAAPIVGAALTLVVGEVAATSLTVGAAAVQLCGTVKPPIEAARPTSAVTGVPPPLGPTLVESVDPNPPAQPNAWRPAPVVGANRPPRRPPRNAWGADPSQNR